MLDLMNNTGLCPPIVSHETEQPVTTTVCNLPELPTKLDADALERAIEMMRDHGRYTPEEAEQQHLRNMWIKYTFLNGLSRYVEI